ncbi:MAG: DNA translocase FtsK 4TM domain-containing protein [Phycisphaerales bacterium]|nr:DNA translocase FtsK 4TM domain-containing protein [Phycisphaerales bacterium]
MARAENRRTALRFCLITLAGIVCAFVWVSLLSFDAIDPPSTSAWPTNVKTHNLCGTWGARAAYYSFYYFGIGAYPALALLSLALVAWARGATLSDGWLRIVGLILVGSCTAVLCTLFVSPFDSTLVTGTGGVVGLAGAHWLVARIDRLGTLIFAGGVGFAGLLMAADEAVAAIGRALMWAGRASAPAVARGGAALAQAGAAAAASVARAATTSAPGSEATSGPNDKSVRSAAPRRPTKIVLDHSDDELGDDEPSGRPPAPGAADAPRSAGRVASAKSAYEGEIAPAARPARAEPAEPAVRPREEKPRLGAQERFEFPRRDDDYTLPPMSMLDDPTPIDKASIDILCREKAYILEQTLTEFRLDVKVVAIDPGPVITMYELKLAPGIKVSQIVSLSNDLARALKAPSVRVVAPLPGKNTIGIEVPNIDKEKVRIKELIVATAAKSEQFIIPMYLGKDASGQALVTDLTRMPHLLIAGTTGSGKSVCVSSVVMSVLLSRTPKEVNLILVDPKVVELAMFKDVPHLMCPIVTDTSKAEGILDWAATKMDERYALLAEAGVKDIRSYNKLGLEELKARLQPANDEEAAKIPVHLPYIVIIVDELADLMMTSAKEVEFYLCRIAQKSRAVGIHLIVSTQRPQANVVTGLIKSNLPCRICFRVSSRLDSRIVLDQNGGEVLMGQGDMLFLPPGSAKLVRAQGTFIDDVELKRVVQHCRGQASPQYSPELVRLPGAAGGDGAEERDELFDQAVDIILESGRGSVSLLQRRLTIGYGRASRLIDQMYVAGIVGEYKGSQAREVVVTKDEWAAMRNQRDREEAQEQQDETQ